MSARRSGVLSGALERLWWRRPAPFDEAWLWPLSLLSLGWRAGSGLGRLAARPERVGAPVISVGNLAVGGAGKTPVALLLCDRLRARGRRPALLSRGHGGSARGEVTWVCRGAGPLVAAEVSGDEPALAALRSPWLPVLVGPRRAALARAAVAAGADVLVLDDGLQHRGLWRDLDVVVADARNPLGNGRLLPRGPLREGPGALERLGARGLLWLTGGGAGDAAPETALLRARAAAAGLQGPVESAFVLRGGERLRGARVVLLAGIARPERFEASVRALGAEVRGVRWFADHHVFTVGELDSTLSLSGAEGARVVTTEKDLVRLPPGFAAEALAGDAVVRGGEDALKSALDRILAEGGDRAAAKPSRGGGA